MYLGSYEDVAVLDSDYELAVNIEECFLDELGDKKHKKLYIPVEYCPWCGRSLGDEK
ncbi:hypothetical protein G5820_000383 [Listeria monocytogenes]|uniref:hypothetical protein n=1 Tax=Listeria monocytogenes TaxID=1639 RepID=UPI0019B6BDE8|nr:hypothetical protein [Listeria monocytogenes]EEO9202965.1 hypothetical protein [Listeria monocytogenes]EJK2963103.1 hypothetical protein [Listeria monocytogenes]HAM1580729.1 hypothetical protein [Listeria monocytogenes]HBI5994308.1 hypothetical protein [Listeria monocytogenes]